MTDRIAELQNTITQKLRTLELSRCENIPLVADAIAALRKNLDQIDSPKQRRAVATIIDNHEAFSTLISELAGNIIKAVSELQATYNEIIQSSIEAHERGQNHIDGLTKPSQN